MKAAQGRSRPPRRRVDDARRDPAFASRRALWAGGLLAVALLGGLAYRAWPRGGGAPGSAAGLSAKRRALPEGFAARPVPTPGLNGLNPDVAAQLQAGMAAVEEQSVRPDANADDLGRAYGDLSKLLLAYELPGAAEALSNAAQLQPEDYRWPYYTALRAYREGRMDDAIAGYATAVALAPQDIPARLHLAESYLEAARPEQAEPLLRAAEDQDPQYFWTHALWGRLESGRGRPAAAIERYERAIALEPNARMLYRPLAAAYRELGQAAKADDLLTRAETAAYQGRDPLLAELAELRLGADVYTRRARELAAAGRLNEALELLRKAVAEDPSLVDAHTLMATVQQQRGDLAGALAAAKAAVALGADGQPGAAALYSLGQAQFDGGDAVAAEASFEAALERDPDAVDAHGALATLFRRAGRCDEALEHLAALIALDGRRKVLYLDRAVCQVAVGQATQARAGLEDALQRFPGDPEIGVTLARLLAAAPDPAARDGARARELAASLVAANRRPDTLEALAMAEAELGSFDQATALQREAVGAAGSDPAWEGWRERLAESLATFEAGMPRRSPWPESVLRR